MNLNITKNAETPAEIQGVDGNTPQDLNAKPEQVPQTETQVQPQVGMDKEKMQEFFQLLLNNPVLLQRLLNGGGDIQTMIQELMQQEGGNNALQELQ